MWANMENAPDSQMGKKKQAQWHSQTDHTCSTPTQLQFYPLSWRDVLEAAKNKFQCFVAARNPYPNREDGIQEAGDCTVEALADHQNEGKKVEPGKMICSVWYLIFNFVFWM
jgi:hypothetical protein